MVGTDRGGGGGGGGDRGPRPGTGQTRARVEQTGARAAPHGGTAARSNCCLIQCPSNPRTMTIP